MPRVNLVLHASFGPDRRRHRHHADFRDGVAPGRPWPPLGPALLHAHPNDAAFLDAIEGIAAGAGHGRVHPNFDHEPGDRMLDLGAVIAAAPTGAHLYCCGRGPMLAAFEAAAAGLPSAQVHVEYFTTVEAPATGGGFTVVLAKSGREVAIEPGSSILDAMLAADIDVPYSCMEGVCVTCETTVLEGVPDHRDLVLTKAEHAANRTMMICCSGSKSARLVLDM